MNEDRNFGRKTGSLRESKTHQKLVQERLRKEEICLVCEIVREDLKCMSGRSLDLSLEDKVLVGLKTLASGSYQNCSKDFMFISQAIVSQILSIFVDAMVKKASHYIYMPKKEEILRVFDDFKQVSYLPRVIGAIDGSHIRIMHPLKTNMLMPIEKDTTLSTFRLYAMQILFFEMW